jgi:lipid-A-disaccharide synthase
MEAAKKRNIPVIWYIVPQVWAWKKKRAATLGGQASFIGTVFPFEVDYFKQYRAPVSFVGHPLVEALEKRALLKTHSSCNMLDSSPTIRIGLIPGSRKQEITHILPEMVKAGMLLKKKYPNSRLLVSRCRHFSEELFQKLCGTTDIEIVGGPLCDLLSKIDIALVTSGTATLETALEQIPLVIVYKTSAFNYALMRGMVQVPYIGLPNIVANEKIVPECIQRDANAANLSKEMEQYIINPSYYAATIEKLSGLKNMLGSKKPSVEIASAIAGLIKS